MNKIVFDSPRFNEMQDFLIHIYTIAIDNPDLILNTGIVYREMCCYGLSSEDLKNSRNQEETFALFPKWIDRNKSNGNYKNGLRVEHRKSMNQFLKFFSKQHGNVLNDENGFIKLYIPLKSRNIYNSVNELFDFITNSRIIHASKVVDRARCDNVIVRLDSNDYEGAKKIFNFIKSNKIISDSLNRTNPFVPCVNGIGMMNESGISYNEEMSKNILNYVYNCINKMKAPIISDFLDWFKVNNHDEEIKEIFDCANGNTKELNIPEKTQNNWNKDKLELSKMYYSDKEKLILDTIKATYQKYGINQTIYAILSLIYFDQYNYFTNGDKNYRIQMSKLVDKDDVIGLINKVVKTNEFGITKKEIQEFCYQVCGSDLLNKINEACLLTFENYGRNNLKHAIRFAITNDNYDRFSRYSPNIDTKINHREIISKIPGKVIFDIIKKATNFKTINGDLSDIDYLIDSYISQLISYQNKSDDFSKKTK